MTRRELALQLLLRLNFGGMDEQGVEDAWRMAGRILEQLAKLEAQP